MRRVFTLLFIIGLLTFVTACGDNKMEDNSVKKFPSPESTESETEDTNEETASDEEQPPDNEDTSNENQIVDEDKVSNIDIIDFEEALVIEDEVDVSGLDVDIQTDNRNNRVILFLDNNEPIYKTIYVKHKQRLKIIDIQQDAGQIFNEVIE